ncbi:MAG: thioredoxin family protein [Deltaproteobacteria bacterium]|nr:thioredoxin family protein [Deltaproteobacteria bacterium]
MDEEVIKITVKGNTLGMVGLTEIFLRAKDLKGLSEIEVEKFFLEEAKKKNYIPISQEGEYAKALLREFKRFLGGKVEEEHSGLQVRVLGLGCVNCRKLGQEILAALAELNLAADFDHVQDIKEIARYGVMGTPALVINGQVKSVGKIPPRYQIKEWLVERSERK